MISVFNDVQKNMLYQTNTATTVMNNVPFEIYTSIPKTKTKLLNKQVIVYSTLWIYWVKAYTNWHLVEAIIYQGWVRCWQNHVSIATLYDNIQNGNNMTKRTGQYFMYI